MVRNPRSGLVLRNSNRVIPQAVNRRWMREEYPFIFAAVRDTNLTAVFTADPEFKSPSRWSEIITPRTVALETVSW
jgi:hypothetical protein